LLLLLLKLLLLKLLLLLLLLLLKLMLLKLMLLELLVDHLIQILLRDTTRRHTAAATRGILHHGVPSRYTHTGGHSKWHTSKGHATTTTSHGVGHDLLGLFLDLGGMSDRSHAKAEARFFTHEELVVERAHIGSIRHTSKTPSTELSGKAFEPGSVEELGKNL
jgi:hypothetical protein